MIRQSIVLNLLGTVVVVLCSAAVEAQSCNCEVSPRKEKAYDVLLELDSEEQANAEALHAPWGGAHSALHCDERAPFPPRALSELVRRLEDSPLGYVSA